MKNLQDIIEEMIDNSQYTEATDYIAKELGVKLIFHGTRFESIQWDKDGQKRYIVDCELKRDKKSYKFEFGTSATDSCVEESEWDAMNDNDVVEIYAGISIKDKSVYGSVKFKFKKSDFDSHESSFIETKAKEMSDNFKKNISEYNEEINAKYKKGSISRMVRDAKCVQSTLRPDEAVVYINNAIRKKREELEGNKVTSKTKALPQATMPTMYDILACMTWYDPETFEDFCANYGYDEDSRSAERIYKSVKKEYNALKNMFNEEEMEAISRIN